MNWKFWKKTKINPVENNDEFFKSLLEWISDEISGEVKVKIIPVESGYLWWVPYYEFGREKVSGKTFLSPVEAIKDAFLNELIPNRSDYFIPPNFSYCTALVNNHDYKRWKYKTVSDNILFSDKAFKTTPEACQDAWLKFIELMNP